MEANEVEILAKKGRQSKVETQEVPIPQPTKRGRKKKPAESSNVTEKTVTQRIKKPDIVPLTDVHITRAASKRRSKADNN
jgi:hypothetical protein